MRRGEVWWVEFDPAVGSEIRKSRPDGIVSNDSGNRNLPRVIVVPLPGNTGRLYAGEALVSIAGADSKAMADQLMTADKVRLKSRLGTLIKAGSWPWTAPCARNWRCLNKEPRATEAVFSVAALAMAPSRFAAELLAFKLFRCTTRLRAVEIDGVGI